MQDYTLYLVLILFYLFLFLCKAERERQICYFTPETPATAGDSGQCQELETLWVSILGSIQEPPLLLPGTHQQESGLEAELGFNPKYTNKGLKCPK